jgi:hypothetical protein
MKAAFTWIAAAILVGCSSAPEAARTTALESSDLKLAKRFLDALYRPRHSADSIVVDASSEQSLDHIPLRTRNRELASRLDVMRRAPDRIRLVIYSGDRSAPYGSSPIVYTYAIETGVLSGVGPESSGAEPSERPDMCLDIRHWPDGRRLVSVSAWWINDGKHDIFHVRPGETKFRFVVASMPLVD